VGSFLNVVIFRVPLGQSIVFPGSRCPKCNQAIRFYDNVPVLSYFVLRGRCRDCGSPISWRYPLIEFVSACLSLALYYKFNVTPGYAIFFVFCASMVAVFWIDLDHMIIPDTISLTGVVVGVVAATLGIIPGMTWQLSLMGVLLGGLILYLPAFIYEKIRGIEGLGGGDIKLMAMIGAFCGPYGVILILLCASLIGALVGLISMVFRGAGSTTPIPFGPFLSASAVLYVFAGQEIVKRLFV